MPTIPSIRISVENKDVLVLDEHAKNGTFKRDAKGRLIAYAGGFSVVFPYQSSNGEKWAFRCWHSDVSNSRNRYETISKAIKDANLEFLCDFEYVDRGIIVDGTIYPTTRMRWIDGVTIKDYICQNKNSSKRLKELADNFLKLTDDLHKKGLAHGDLQHGNILVGKDHSLYLVDYDSFYCPALKGQKDTVTGLPDYQHPSRKNNKAVSEKLDYFSELIIYLSIKAIEKSPSLVDKYNVDGAERLLFSKEDYLDLKNSSIYKDISSLGSEFKEMLNVLEKYLSYDSINKLGIFNEILLEDKVKFSVSAKKAIRSKQEVTVKWNVPFKSNVLLKQKNKKLKKVCESTGSYSTVLDSDEVFELAITTDKGKKITRKSLVRVFDECSIDFLADKHYVFPSIPITLSWDVKNAKKVWLGSEEIDAAGKKVVEQDRETTYTLVAEDEFGKKEKSITVGMLPVPQVKSLLVPVPDIINNMSITIKQPRLNVDVRFPQIDIGWIKTEVPRVKSFNDLGLNVELLPPPPKKTLGHFLNYFRAKKPMLSEIKSLFEYYLKR